MIMMICDYILEVPNGYLLYFTQPNHSFNFLVHVMRFVPFVAN